MLTEFAIRWSFGALVTKVPTNDGRGWNVKRVEKRRWRLREANEGHVVVTLAKPSDDRAAANRKLPEVTMALLRRTRIWT